MAKDIEIKWNKPIPQIVKETMGGDATLKFMATTWHRLYTPFVPMQTGTLALDAVTYSVEDGKGVITHTPPYARKMYNGVGFNFRTDRHSLAQAKWDQGAKQAGKAAQLARETQAYIRKRGG